MTIVTDDVQRGIPRVEGTETTVLEVYDAVEEYGVDPEQVARDFGVAIGDVYEALAYYHRHPKEMHEARETRREITRSNVG